jgi:hypothetical protein
MDVALVLAYLVYAPDSSAILSLLRLLLLFFALRQYSYFYFLPVKQVK